MIKQVLISFLIGRYSDEVLCDVVPMHTSHLLLGYSWQFDKKAMHDMFRNMNTIIKDGKNITFVPLSSKQIYGYQIKLKRRSEVVERGSSSKEHVERIKSDLAINELKFNLAKSWGKKKRREESKCVKWEHCGKMKETT